MANICNNTLEVYPKILDDESIPEQKRIDIAKYQIQEFVNKYFSWNIKQNYLYLDFNKIVPPPKRTDKIPAKYSPEEKFDPSKPSYFDSDGIAHNFNYDWYEWNYDMWETKWNPHPLWEPDFFDGTHLQFNYETAYCPGFAVISKLIKENPDYIISNSYDDGFHIAGCQSSIKDDNWSIETEDEVEFQMALADHGEVDYEEVYDFIIENVQDQTAKRKYLEKYFPEKLTTPKHI